jgi:hypothetical protein
MVIFCGVDDWRFAEGHVIFAIDVAEAFRCTKRPVALSRVNLCSIVLWNDLDDLRSIEGCRPSSVSASYFSSDFPGYLGYLIPSRLFQLTSKSSRK